MNVCNIILFFVLWHFVLLKTVFLTSLDYSVCKHMQAMARL